MVAATVETTALPEARVYSYRDVPDSDTISIPNGETVFSSVSTVVAAAGAADADQAFLVDCVLPVNYAYVPVDAFVRLFSATNNVDLTWDLCAFGQYRNNASPTVEIPVEACADGRMPGLVEKRAQMIWNFSRYNPKAMLRPETPSAQIHAKFFLYHAGLNGPAVTALFYFRFLNYGILQSNNWEANSPQLVR